MATTVNTPANGQARVLPTLKALPAEDVSIAFDAKAGTMTLTVAWKPDRQYDRPVSKKTGEPAKNELIAEVGSRFGAFSLPEGYVVNFYLGKKTDPSVSQSARGSTVKLS